MKDNEFFSSSLNGYNKKEVIGYLEKLNRQADEVEARHRTEVEALRTELEALSKERESLSAELGSSELTCNTLRAEIEDLKKQLENSDKATADGLGALESIRAERDRASAELALLREKLDSSMRENATLAEQNERLKQRDENSGDIVAAAEAKAKELISAARLRAATVTAERVSDILHRIDLSRDSLEALDARVQSISEGLSDIKQQVDAADGCFKKILCGDED